MGTENTIKSRTLLVISILSNGQLNRYDFISLATINLFHAFNWTEFLINDYVINMVEEM